MHLWRMKEWEKSDIYFSNKMKFGIHFIFEDGCNPEVRRAILKFSRWLRREFVFPSRLNVYIKYSLKIMAFDGDLVSATFFGPFDKNDYSYIRVAVGDYEKRISSNEIRDNILASYLQSIAHEISHYYQWLNSLSLTDIGIERQATIYASNIIDEYALYTDRP